MHVYDKKRNDEGRDRKKEKRKGYAYISLMQWNLKWYP